MPGVVPFASLETHNRLTAVWFEFLMDNATYFEDYQFLANPKDLRKAKYLFSRKRIGIIRLRLKVNTKLSRLRDAKLIECSRHS